VKSEIDFRDEGGGLQKEMHHFAEWLGDHLRSELQREAWAEPELVMATAGYLFTISILHQPSSSRNSVCWLRELCAMPDYSVHKAGDLARDERLLIERWLGRPISNDETISVNAYRPHVAPTGNEREILWQEIMRQAREISSRVQDADEKEIDALIDEAFAATRGGRG